MEWKLLSQLLNHETSVNHPELFTRQGSVRESVPENVKRDFSTPQRNYQMHMPIGTALVLSQEGLQSTT